MKKENMELKEVIKVAILEAFAEMYGVATMTEGEPDVPQPDNENNGEGSNTGGNTGNNGGSNTGGNNSGNTGGNTKPGGPIEPQPIVGSGGLSFNPERKE